MYANKLIPHRTILFQWGKRDCQWYLLFSVPGRARDKFCDVIHIAPQNIPRGSSRIDHSIEQLENTPFWIDFDSLSFPVLFPSVLRSYLPISPPQINKLLSLALLSNDSSSDPKFPLIPLLPHINYFCKFCALLSEILLVDTLKCSIMHCVICNSYIMNLTLISSKHDTKSSLFWMTNFVKFSMRCSQFKLSNLNRSFPLKDVFWLQIFK